MNLPRAASGFNYPVEYKSGDPQPDIVFIECTFRYVASETTESGEREMKNRRRRASIPGRKSAPDLTEYKCSLKNETNV